METLSPLDSRYSHLIKPISRQFGEIHMLKNRIKIEVSWLLTMITLTDTELLVADAKILNDLIDGEGFGYDEYAYFESVHKHDIKAVVELIKSKLTSPKIKSLVHFGLTSEDIVSTSNNMAFRESMKYIKDMQGYLLENVSTLSNNYTDSNSLMVARTHGQLAIPTTFLQQLVGYSSRLHEMDYDLDIVFCKFGGAIGTNVGLRTVLPNVDWSYEIGRFVDELADYPICVTQDTTQTDYYHYICEILGKLKGFLLATDDMCTDMWMYCNNGNISMKTSSNSTGSSTMSHKSNPILFENSMANSRLAVSLIDHFINNMSKSMMQRDLTSSSLLRNLGTILGYAVVSIRNATRGIKAVVFNSEFSETQVDSNWQMAAEYVQLYLKINHDCDNSEEIVKNHFRGYNNSNGMDKNQYLHAIKSIYESMGIDADYSTNPLGNFDIKSYI